MIWHCSSSLFILHVERLIQICKVCRCSTGSIWSVSLCINKRLTVVMRWSISVVSLYGLCIPHKRMICFSAQRYLEIVHQMKEPGVYTALQDKHLNKYHWLYLAGTSSRTYIVSVCVLICFCTSYKPSCEIHYHYHESFLLSKSPCRPTLYILQIQESVYIKQPLWSHI